MHSLITEVYKIVKELIGAIADIQLRLEELEEDSHPPVNWEEIIHTNVERIESLERAIKSFEKIMKHLERKLIEREHK